MELGAPLPGLAAGPQATAEPDGAGGVAAGPDQQPAAAHEVADPRHREAQRGDRGRRAPPPDGEAGAVGGAGAGSVASLAVQV